MADLRIVDAPEIPTEDITGQEKLPTGGSGNYSITLDSVANYTKTKKDLADNTSVDGKVNGVRQELDAHIEDLLNPHQVTKDQIGLGDVDNTADADKPVSNSTQAAIISAVFPKADKAYVDNQLTFKANKADVYTKSETYTKQEGSALVNSSISTALTPVNTSLDLAKRGIVNRYTSSLTYNMGERVVLTNGDIVKSTIDENTNDPNVDMTGWVKTNSTSQIFDESGKTQQEINNLKANEAYVDSQDSSLQLQINQKAETEYVDTALSNLSTAANKFYPAFAAANADIANIQVDQPVTIGESANGGLWYKATAEATSLTKSAYDPLTQAKLYTDKAVSDVIKKGVNLFNKDAVTRGKYYNYQNGELWNTDAILFAASEFIEVEPNTEYQVPTFCDEQFAFFDANKVFISGMQNALPTFKFTTPINAKYIGLTVRVPQFDTFMFCKSSEFPSTYEPYRLSIDNLAIESSNVLGLKNSVEKVVGIYEANIIDLSKVTVGKYVPYSNGELWDNSASTAMGYYEVKASTKYKTSSFYNQQFAFYDAEKKYISGLVSPDVNHEFTTPTNAVYVRFTVPNDQVNDLVIAESSVFSDGYKPHSVNIDNLKVNTNQVLDFENQVREIAHLENVNIFDPSVALNGKYYNYQNGELWDAAWASAGLYEVEPNTIYKTSTFYDQQFAFFDENKAYISGQANALPDNIFTTPSNAKYIGLTVPNAQINTLVVAKQSIFPTVYVPFGMSTFGDVILPNYARKTTKLTVSATANGANAIQNKIDSITDATDKNRYQIDVAAGVYKVEQANQFLGYPTYPAMICPKNHIDIVGKGLDKTIVWAELPYIDANISNASNGESYPRERYQTIYNYADDVTIQGITFVGQNLRYTMHQDDSRGVNTKRHYVDCGFVFKGDKGWGQTLGIGTYSGEETYVKGGYSQSDTLFAFACHNNVDFKYPSVWSFENHTFSSLGDAQAISMQSCGSLVDDKLELIGCSFGGRSYILTYGDSSWMTATENRDYFNHAEWKITGYGNDPFLFNNVVEDSCLRFKTTATGVSTSIRFDKNSSAYPLLIKNNRLNTDKSAYTGRDYIDGYIVQDGSIDMSAQAWGCRDVSERVYIYDGSTNFTSLGKRLGDCSTTNKALGVIVNGTSNTITFNKNYSAMTNAQIITEMNGQLSGATVSLYSYGRDYYPQLSDATEVVYNTGATFIPKGSVIAKSKSEIRLANENDKVYGVALDDIPVVRLDANGAKKGQGRVLKRGYISANRSRAHYVLADNQSPEVGARFKVVNGQLITDVNGNIGVDIDDGVISINC